MATPVYKVFLFKPVLESYQATQEQRDAMMAQHDAFFQQAGGKILLGADMSWSNEEFEYFGIEEFPSMEALIEFHDCLRSIGWFGWFQAKTYVGYNMDGEGNLVDFVLPPPPKEGETPLYKIFFLSYTPYGYEHQAEQAEKYEGLAKLAQESGVVDIMTVYTRVTNEAWMAIGLQRYPNEQALLDSYLYMERNDWFKYVQTMTYVGKGIGGLLVEQK